MKQLLFHTKINYIRLFKVKIVFALFFICTISIAQKGYLQLDGNVHVANSPLKDALVKVFKDEKVSEVVKTDNDGLFQVQLPLNKIFRVEVSKEKLVCKKFVFYTALPDNHKVMEYKFDLNVGLFPRFEELDLSILDEPIVDIFFNKSRGGFYYNVKKAKERLEEISLLQMQIDKIMAERQKLYDVAIRIADDKFKNKEYKSARSKYVEALQIFPHDMYADFKIKEIDNIIKLKDEEEKRKLNKNEKYTLTNASRNVSKSPTLNENIDVGIEPSGKEDNNSLPFSEPDNSQDESGIMVNNEELKEDVVYNQENNNPVNGESRQLYDVADTSGFLKQLHFYDSLLQDAIHNKDSIKIGVYANIVGSLYFYVSDNNKALDLYDQALNIKRALNDNEGEAIILNNIGVVSESMLHLDDAIDIYTDEIDVYLGLSDSVKVADGYYKIGQLYNELAKYNSAIQYFEKTLDIDLEHNENDVASTLNAMANVHYNKDEFDQALTFYERSLLTDKQYGNKAGIGVSWNNIGNVYFYKDEYKSALDYYNKSLKIKKKQNNQEGLAITYHNIGNVYNRLKKIEEALNYISQSDSIATLLGMRDVLFRNYLLLSQIYAKDNDCFKSHEYYKKYTEMRFYVSKYENIKQIAEVKQRQSFKERNQRLLFEISKHNQTETLNSIEIHKAMQELRKRKEKALLETEYAKLEISSLNKSNKQKSFIIIAISAGLMLIVLILIGIFRQLRIKKRTNSLLTNKNVEITKQRDEIQDQRDLISYQKTEITDSIQYARRIQNAILSSTETLDELGKDYFLLYKPCQIVSGDFYWLGKTATHTVIVVADCTGHGVPGAFMSMLGISSFNDIVKKSEDISADEILNILRDRIIGSLHQKDGSNATQDGMDIALCMINHHDNKIQFAGANNSLLLISEGNITELKGDRMPIGVSRRLSDKFTLKEIEVKSGDLIYLTTDGFVDQFGGARNKKFGRKRYKEMLLEISKKPLNDQKSIVDESFSSWKDFDSDENNKSNHSQIDDVLVFGVKI